MKAHNPDGLTDEQIGVADGWRLLDEDELIANAKLIKQLEVWIDDMWVSPVVGFAGCVKSTTYRTQLTRAELRVARELDGREGDAYVNLNDPCKTNGYA